MSRALIAGGGAPEIHVSRLLTQYAQTLKGKEAYCFQAFAEALEIIPTTLAENAGLNPIAIVTELRNKHAKGDKLAGINVKKVCALAVTLDTAESQGIISNILAENVVQPLLVSTSALELATETVALILRIDDIQVGSSNLYFYEAEAKCAVHTIVTICSIMHLHGTTRWTTGLADLMHDPADLLQAHICWL